MPDLADPSASERLKAKSRRALGGFGGLHPVTRLVIVAALIQFLGVLLTGAATVLKQLQGGYGAVSLEAVAGVLSSTGYALTLFGGAATVEFLFRIWREVVLLRKAREISTD